MRNVVRYKQLYHRYGKLKAALFSPLLERRARRLLHGDATEHPKQF